MGCGTSKEAASAVLNNTVTQNGDANIHSNGSDAHVNKDAVEAKTDAPSSPPTDNPDHTKDDSPSPDNEPSNNGVPDETNPEQSEPLQAAENNSEENNDTAEGTGETEEKQSEEAGDSGGTAATEEAAPDETSPEEEASNNENQTSQADDTPEGENNNSPEEETQGPDTEETGDAFISPSDINNQEAGESEQNEKENGIQDLESSTPATSTGDLGKEKGGEEDTSGELVAFKENENDDIDVVPVTPPAAVSPSPTICIERRDFELDGESCNNNAEEEPGPSSSPAGETNDDNISENQSGKNSASGTRGNSQDSSGWNENDPESARMQSPERIIPADESLRDEIEDGQKNKEERRNSSRNSQKSTTSARTIISKGSHGSRSSSGKEGNSKRNGNEDGGDTLDDDDGDSGVVDDNEIPKTKNDEIGDDEGTSTSGAGDTITASTSPTPAIMERRKGLFG